MHKLISEKTGIQYAKYATFTDHLEILTPIAIRKHYLMFQTANYYSENLKSQDGKRGAKAGSHTVDQAEEAKIGGVTQNLRKMKAWI